MSQEDMRFETLMKEQMVQGEDGHFVAPLPLKDPDSHDAIGDTLYSERGLLRTLMALNAAVPRYLGLERSAGEGGDAGGDGAGESSEDGGGDGPPLMELDAELEEQLCQLWDMTAERAVAEFAAASGLLEVVWPLLDRSPCPRLLEIVAGALANCAGHGAKALPGGADTAAAAPEPERLLRALAGWLPLLADVLRGALSAPLLRQALGLLAAVAELPERRAWWLGELAAARELPAAVLEGLAQLVGGGGAGVTAAEALDCCRDSLLLLAEVEAMEGAEKPDTGQSVPGDCGRDGGGAHTRYTTCG
ncbi:Protein saal1 [Amphibalanus amphitrite]|uniref:Protein saal1 n=1 Tax=Amphibalanus amphitrite TaxID=1232801 RepID=A0A6A4VPG1_AMPAM|nr:Protein saal1 [Amphibalanus amphitrite]